MLVMPAASMIPYFRLGANAAVAGVGVAFAAVVFSSGIEYALFYAMMFGVLGLALAFIAKRSQTISDYLIPGIFVSTLAKLAVMVILGRTVGINPFAVDTRTVEHVTKALSDLPGSTALPGLGSAPLADQIAHIASTVSLLVPYMVVMVAAADTVLSFVIASIASASRKEDSEAVSEAGEAGATRSKLPHFAPIGEWRFPKNVVWAFVAAMVFAILEYFNPESRLFKMLALNLEEISRVIFLIQGISLMWFFMELRGWARPIRVAAVFLGVGISVFSYMLSMVGIFDLWFDLRSRIRRHDA